MKLISSCFRAILPAVLAVVVGQSVWAQTNYLLEADTAYSNGDYEAAEPLYVQAVESFGDLHEEGYTRALARLANCYYMSGQLKRAADTYNSVIKLDEQLHGAQSLPVADDLYCLSRALRRQSLFDAAEPVIRRLLGIRLNLLGSDHRLVAMTWMDLAVNYQRQGRLEDAESAFLSSIAIRDKLNEPKFAATAYFWYAKLLQLENRLPEAQKVMRHAQELNPEAYGG